MNVYLVQHGRPVPKEQDSNKPLSKRGREEVERMASFLKEACVGLEEIWHSGKIRAEQTAELLDTHLQTVRKTRKQEGISPMDDPENIKTVIEKRKRDVMIVGHLPHLTKLVSLMTTGGKSGTLVIFQQGGVVCLRSREDQKGWGIAWMLVPELVP